jgi:hypothetical protein
LRAVGPIVGIHVNSGALYFPFPPNSNKSSGFSIMSSDGPPFLGQIPCTLFQPLLNPGLTGLISSPNPGPFSVSHRLPVTGSKSIPKLFRIP